jgi:hypothetical protein
MENSTFFEHGYVKLVANDYDTRSVSVNICMPCTLLQAISPQLLGAGLLDHFRLHNPVAIWIPQLSDERFSPGVRHDGIAKRLNIALREEIVRTCKLFEHVSQYLIDPTDIIPVLPLGVYVEFTYRCHVDRILGMLEGIDSINIIGIPEFQWSFAGILKECLEDFAKIDQTRSRLHSGQ